MGADDVGGWGGSGQLPAGHDDKASAQKARERALALGDRLRRAAGEEERLLHKLSERMSSMSQGFQRSNGDSMSQTPT